MIVEFLKGIWYLEQTIKSDVQWFQLGIQTKDGSCIGSVSIEYYSEKHDVSIKSDLVVIEDDGKIKLKMKNFILPIKLDNKDENKIIVDFEGNSFTLSKGAELNE